MEKHTISDLFRKAEKEMGYKGCRNCKHQIEPLRMCEWAEKKTETNVYIICPRWEKREESNG